MAFGEGPTWLAHYNIFPISLLFFKVVLHRSHGYFFRVKVKTVKLIGLLFMPAQTIQTIAFIQIMDIWRPGRSLEDHLKIMVYIIIWCTVETLPEWLSIVICDYLGQKKFDNDPLQLELDNIKFP